MGKVEFWCVWDPLEQEEHLFEDFDDAMNYVRELCKDGLEVGDAVRIAQRMIVFRPRAK